MTTMRFRVDHINHAYIRNDPPSAAWVLYVNHAPDNPHRNATPVATITDITLNNTDTRILIQDAGAQLPKNNLKKYNRTYHSSEDANDAIRNLIREATDLLPARPETLVESLIRYGRSKPSE